MKYFYSDPVAVVWMGKYFGMKFNIPESKSPVGYPDVLRYLAAWSDLIRDAEISEESLYLLNKVDGDVVEGKKVIQRGGNSFMWPECSE